MRAFHLSVVLLLSSAQAATLVEGLDLTMAKCRCTHGPAARCACVHHAGRALPPCHQARKEAPARSELTATCCGAARSHGPAVLTWLTLPEPEQGRVERVLHLDFDDAPSLSSAFAPRPPRPPPRDGLSHQA